MYDEFNSNWRFGSAGFADDASIEAAGLFGPHGLQVGFKNGRTLRYSSDAPMLTAGASGSGKGNGVISYALCRSPGETIVALDPKGENARISMVAHAHHHEDAYIINPYSIAELPHHGCDPLRVLDPKSPAFFADCKEMASALVALQGKAEDDYWAQRARSWIADFLISIALRDGRPSFPALYRLINTIIADPQAWADHAEFMLSLDGIESVKRTAAEILLKQAEAPREFGSIMGTIFAAVAFLDDPVLLRSLERVDFSLEAVVSRTKANKLFLVFAAEHLGGLASLIRAYFMGLILIKGRAPDAKRITFLIDEAAQLKSFPALVTLQTYGRGVGIRTWTFWQDLNQISTYYGTEAMRTFTGSCGMIQQFGLRVYSAAEDLSQRLGYQTLSYDDRRLQMEAAHRRHQAFQRLAEGGDALAAILEAHHHGQMSEMPSQQARRVQTADEIIAQPDTTQWLSIAGAGLKMILAEKYPHYTRPEMTGYYLPNPYHPPLDRVTIPSKRGPRTLRVITERVPTAFAHMPQYQDGYWSYVEGYRLI
jgi:type IV secretion system protein VirD4